MEIKFGNGYPSSALSNFAPHKFIFDGIYVASMEGLLQAFKYNKEHVQIEICKLVGLTAKRKGSRKNWQERQTLYWKGVAYKRDSQEYQDLLDRAYSAITEQSESFRKALLATRKAVLTHSIGRSKQNETVLTRQEFCSRLTHLRSILQDQELSWLK